MELNENGLIILPESKKPGRAPLLYVMYSDIVEKGWEKYEKFFDKSSPLKELKIRKKKPKYADASEKILYLHKQLRDMRR